MKSFTELGLNKSILRAIEDCGFEKPTEVQEESIPLILEGKDIIAKSATGSGKTLAFAAGMLHKHKGKGIHSLVLTPTRELAAQITKALEKFSKYDKLSVTEIYGGVSINPQIQRLRKTDIVVGTPGRILDHIERRTIDLRNVDVVVLDEADRMLDMGFIDDVKKIISFCPKKRQTLLFSATFSKEIYELAKNYMHNAQKISVEDMVDPKKLKQIYYDVPQKLKFSLLVHLLNEEKSGLVMVFCNTQKGVDFVAKNLKANNFEAIAIHGGLTQAKREHVLKKFHSNKAHVLVCTDVAARGLDIKAVSHVYNFDIPNESKQYVHRIGRTARAGEEGIAINLLSERDHQNFGAVLRDNGVKIEKIDRPKVEMAIVKFSFNKPRRSGGRPGSRGPRSGQRPSSNNRGGFSGGRGRRRGPSKAELMRR
jgi:ATP-dependent RNA helicase DeaD